MQHRVKKIEAVRLTSTVRKKLNEFIKEQYAVRGRTFNDGCVAAEANMERIACSDPDFIVTHDQIKMLREELDLPIDKPERPINRGGRIKKGQKLLSEVEMKVLDGFLDGLKYKLGDDYTTNRAVVEVNKTNILHGRKITKYQVVQAERRIWGIR